MYKILSIVILIAVLFTMTVNAAEKKNAPAKPMKGKVASLNGIIAGGDGKVDKTKAMELAEKGQPIVFVVGEGKKAKIYFVYNEDGSFAGKNLAKFAANKFVGIVGTAKTVNGINYIITSKIESMD